MFRERLPAKRHRIAAFGAVVVLCVAVLGFQGVMASEVASSPADESTSGNTSVLAPNNTLVSVQAYGWFGRMNGSVRIVTPAGETVWEYAPEDSAVFDAELVDNSTVLVSMGTQTPAAECPDRFDGRGSCVQNRVVEVAIDNKSVVWEHSWYDAFVTHHEVHDADRLPSGETAIIDMGNSRAFTVAENGTKTWEWNASEYLGNGSDFQEQYGGPDKQGPESDWTHMNDIDRLENGNFQLSVRNFDTILEVDPDTDEIVSMVGEPGNHDLIQRQHNPQRLESKGTVLVADSENDRIVEIDVETEEIVWGYEGRGSGRPLQWPRDADRLPGGNTLIADSRNFRVLEINATGDVVWEYSLREERGIVYEADRIGFPEEPSLPSNATNATADSGAPGVGSGQFLMEYLHTVESWAGFFLPGWMRWPELLVLAAGALATLLLSLEGLASLVGRIRTPN